MASWSTAQGSLEDYYSVNEVIGRGAFSIVYEGQEKSTKDLYAIKSINKSKIKKKLLDREIEIMTTIRHPNILFCKAVFETERNIHLVLELVRGGELYDKIVDEGEYTEEETKYVIHQIVDAVEYLHQNGIAHRDLKPENILCTTTTSSGHRLEHIKVADFGLSKMFSREDLISQCGSPTYVAPEVLLAKPYDQAVDMWAIGVITFVMLTGCFPFFEEGHNYSALYQKIINVEYTFPEDPPLSSDARDFVSKLLVKEADQRNTPRQCREHPWLMSSTIRRN